MTSMTLEESSNLAENLSNLLKKHEITITELARQIDAKQPVLYRIAHGMTKNPSILTLVPIVRYFGITLNQLMGEPEAIPNRSLNASMKIRPIPILTTEQIAKYPEHIDWSNAINATQVDVPISDKGFGMLLNDSTMAPQFMPGYTLIFDPALPTKDRTYVAIRYAGGHIGFKQLLLDGQNRYLKSVNPDFPIQTLKPEDEIIGTLVQARFNTVTQISQPEMLSEVEG